MFTVEYKLGTDEKASLEYHLPKKEALADRD